MDRIGLDDDPARDAIALVEAWLQLVGRDWAGYRTFRLDRAAILSNTPSPDDLVDVLCAMTAALCLKFDVDTEIWMACLREHGRQW